jgi:hypothetical protein
MDIYVTLRDIVRILDFNPYGWTTQPLLFTWDELEPCADTLQQEQPKNSPRTVDPEAGCSVSQSTSNQSPVCKRRVDRVEIRLVEDVMHIQAGAAATSGAPADVHLHFSGCSWNAVMSTLERETKQLECE